MSKVFKTAALGSSVLAAVRGMKIGSRLESPDDAEKPEDMEGDEDRAEGDDDPAAEGDEPETMEGDDDPDAEGDEDRAEGDKDPDAEGDDPEAKKASRIRRAEQRRIQAILTHPKADANAGLAAELAFGARHYPVKEATALLSTSAAGGRLAGRMGANSPRIGSGTAASAGNERQSLVAMVGKTISAMHGRKPAKG